MKDHGVYRMSGGEELAYCAGVIDSDGTIGIKRSTYKARVVKDCEQPTYSERICVRQVRPEAVDLLVRLFRGSRYMTKPSARRGKALYTWQVTDKLAATAIEALMPYLRIKREQAANCLALRFLKETSRGAMMAKGRGHAGAAPRPDHISLAMELAYRRAKELNSAGV